MSGFFNDLMTSAKQAVAIMNDELYADLLASAEEIVKIEQGELMPKSEHVHTYTDIDVQVIRERSDLK
ncbi:hypothetical protein AAEY45_003296 [Yersinia enterocolitica]